MHDGIRGIGLSCSVAPGVVHDGGVGPRRKGNIDWIQGWKKRTGVWKDACDDDDRGRGVAKR